MEPTTTAHQIEATPDVCGGKPRIAGTRIRVQDIAGQHETWGRSPDEICDAFDGLTLGQVHAALAYYYDHRDEIHRDIERQRAFVEQYERDHPSLLAQRVNGNHAGADSVPPR